MQVGGGVMQVFVKVFKTFGNTQIGSAVTTTASTPNGAKGFGRPSFPSGVSIMLESCLLILIKALSEKIESSNFILLTLKSKAKKSFAIAELFSIAGALALDALSVEVETKVAVSGAPLIKYT